MRRISCIGVSCGALLVSTLAAAATLSPVDQIVDDFIYDSLAASPTSASQAGYHRHHGVNLDDMLDDYSPKAVAALRNLNQRIDARIAKLDKSKLDAEQRADLEVLQSAIGNSQLDIDEIQSWRHNPTVYVEMLGTALYSLYTLHYAPEAERYGHIINRLKRVPELVRQAEQELQDSPQEWNQVAREEDQGNVDLIDSVLRKDCPAALRADYDKAAAEAIAALHGFDGWLEKNLSAKVSDWRLGKEKYARKFRFSLVTGKTPEQLLKEAETDLALTRQELVKLAAPKSVEQALADVAAIHATPQTYMAQAKSTLASATAFVKAKELLTLPPNANLQVIDTPMFMRGVYAVGGFNPAPALEPKLGAFYWVTPIPANWPQARIDSKLREYNKSGLEHLSVHEAMPGHYVQAEYANDIQPKSRRLLRNLDGNTPYVEGWAVYTQQMMADAGYMSDTPGYQIMLKKQMLRVLANTILDVRLQTMGMTDAQAIELMTKDTYQEMEEATAKLQRAKLSSCQLPTYYAGFKGWMDVRAHYRAAHPNATLKQFHEAALREGAVPLPVLDDLLK
jgi:uncharacterized protein (DUF885 family)